MNKLFSTLVIFFLSMLTAYSQFVPSFTPFQDNARLGLLDRDSKVLTPQKPYIHNGYPVFEITVPAGYTEVQVRASLTNFEPGFLLKKDGVYIAHYIPTGEIVNGKKKYEQLGTYEHPNLPDINEIFTIWDGTKWNFSNGALSSQLFSADVVEFPWLCTNFTGGVSGSTYSVQIEYFVYRTCTTGAAADAEWGLGSGDPDPWVYIANQTAVSGDMSEFKRQKWNSATALTDQLQSGGTPGYKVIFQPSRGNLGAAEWMQHNKDKLVWIYQVENVAGKPLHPNGSDVWNSMVPVEWRTNRIELFSGEAQAAATAYINAVTAAGVTVTSTQRSAILSFIQNEVLLGRWAGIKRLYFPIWEVQAANAICMKSLTSGTWTGGTVNHAAGYVQSTRTGGYMNTNTNFPALGITKDSYHFAVVYKTAPFGGDNYTDISFGSSDVFSGMDDGYHRINLGEEGFSPDDFTNKRLLSIGGNASTRYIKNRTGGLVTTITINNQVINNNFSASDIYFLRGNVTGARSSEAQTGLLSLGTTLTTEQDAAYTLALKTLWETCTGLTLQ